MKGYKLSTDYDLLWDLINNGYIILGWITNNEFSKPIYHSVEVKMQDNNEASIRSGSKGYSGHNEKFDGFESVCKNLDLKFILPKYK